MSTIILQLGLKPYTSCLVIYLGSLQELLSRLLKGHSKDLLCMLPALCSVLCQDDATLLQKC